MTPRHARTRGAHAALLSGIWEGRPLGQTLLSLVLTAGSIPLLMEAMTLVIEGPYTFHVDAKSEVLTLTTEELSGTGWYLENAEARQESPLQAAAAGTDEASFIELPTDRAPRPWESFTGYVEVGPHARVTLTRQGSGPLSIHIAAARDAPATTDTAQPAAVLKPLSGDDRQASRDLELQVMLTEQPLNGTLQGLGAIGGDAYSPSEPASPPLLRTGEVSVVGRRLGSELLYTVMAVPLRLGDEVRVMTNRAALDNPDGEGLREAMAAFTCTFSVVGAASDGTGIDLACHASGRSLAISRFGARIGSLQPRPWDVLANEPSMQAILPLGLTALFALFHRLLDSLYPRLCGWTNKHLRRLGVIRDVDHPVRRWAVHRRARRETRGKRNH
ncbi:hypothetical protein FEI13_16320 [Halomonas urmiana]|uniref:Uncharacterized protein n=1 Tax=Halomonas urmiana TaxID=490901 RepID=A0A5R8MCL3_9GAMM|nr:hypothetical protein [Halomonas urmiana]TLF47240.1 hypothetical protein FEI13_16320 [Halomonas urmiana]